jgi:hypothetical protein
MNQNTNQDQSRPDLLAGYADNEIGPADRAGVETRIAADPAANAELELQQRLSRQNTELWAKAAPPEPSEAAWNRVLAGIHNGVKAATVTPSYRTVNKKWHRWALASAAIAALVFAAISQTFLRGPDNGIARNPAISDDPIQLVQTDDVTILSLQGDDGMVVIGRSPLAGPIDLVTVGDTELWAISTDVSETPSKPSVSPGDPHRPIWVDKTIPVP